MQINVIVSLVINKWSCSHDKPTCPCSGFAFIENLTLWAIAKITLVYKCSQIQMFKISMFKFSKVLIFLFFLFCSQNFFFIFSSFFASSWRIIVSTSNHLLASLSIIFPRFVWEASWKQYKSLLPYACLSSNQEGGPFHYSFCVSQ